MTSREQVLRELDALVIRALPRLAPGGGPMPAPAPAPGQDRNDWLAEVRRIRARHDASAVQAADLLAGLLHEQFGADPFDIGDTVSARWARSSALDGTLVGTRWYLPDGLAAAPDDPGVPAIVFVHGGGYWMGGGAAGWHINDLHCRALAALSRAVVVSVDHRLGPEHPYPAPLDDVAGVFARCSGGGPGTALPDAPRGVPGIDPRRVALYGASSGGNLVAATSQRCRYEEFPRAKAVVLQTASLDLSSGSSRYNGDDDAQREAADRTVAMYAGAGDPADPRISPALCPDLSGLPPTLVITASDDPLTIDANQYADRLAAADVAVTRKEYPMTHAVATPTVWRQLVMDTASWLGRRLSA